MPRPLRIAICQFASEPPSKGSNDSVSTNVARLESFVSSATSQHADLIVFPEYFLTGVIAEHLHLASDEGHWVEMLQNLARKYSIDIVAGTIVEKSSLNDEHLFNTARYIDKHGEVLGEYRKKNLWHPEKEYLQSATEDHQVFQTEKFKAGLLICWDLAWPEAFRALMLQGVEVVIVPTCWLLDDVGEIGKKYDPDGSGEAAWVDSMVVNRAYENECCVIFVKFVTSITPIMNSLMLVLIRCVYDLSCGGLKENGIMGHSSVSLPFKGAITRMEGVDEEMRVVDVDLDILEVPSPFTHLIPFCVTERVIAGCSGSANVELNLGWVGFTGYRWLQLGYLAGRCPQECFIVNVNVILLCICGQANLAPSSNLFLYTEFEHAWILCTMHPVSSNRAETETRIFSSKKFIEFHPEAFRDPSSPYHIKPGTHGPSHPNEIPGEPVSAADEGRLKLTEQGYDPDSFWDQPIVWGDHDAFQHVNNVRYVRFFESGRMHWISAIGHKLGGQDRAQKMLSAKGVSFILKSIEVNFRRPVRFPDTLLIAHKPAPFVSSSPSTHTPPLSRTQFLLHATAWSYAQRNVVATSTSVITWYDYDHLRKCDPGDETWAPVLNSMK
ncbi:hypothetical protein EW146_g3991 [Bondarzewia mesenterica]|uniref:CN hydrolase domain-containing protein n=1 Tax=Bondarzewia mesenterica TaxID=1095465 RepID=A0A4S4LXQ5_9AGAM|nr:hypothetical protein EW146_g3991 [Bondarzewia mesenterica]